MILIMMDTITFSGVAEAKVNWNDSKQKAKDQKQRFCSKMAQIDI